MTDLKPILVEEELYYYSLSFDITDEFIGDGLWWLQIYDSNKKIIYDKTFASSMRNFDDKDVTNGVLEGLTLLRLL